MSPDRSTATPDAADSPTEVAARLPPIKVVACHEVIAHASQPSAGFVLPSSHASPTSRMASPQSSTLLQSAEQPSPPAVLPSSHASPTSTTPLPQPPETQTPRSQRPTTAPTLQLAPWPSPSHAVIWSPVAHSSLATQVSLDGQSLPPHTRSFVSTQPTSAHTPSMRYRA